MRLPQAPSWNSVLQPEFAAAYWQRLEAFVDHQRRTHPGEIFPPESQVFAALEQVARPATKVVILGQDPYHGPGQAHGLAFSVARGVPPPPSLKNIFRELQADLEIAPPSHGCLDSWARQGVLLLNTVLTVRQGAAHSHRKRGWEVFTDALISTLGQQSPPLVFLLWGNAAISKANLIDQRRHAVLRAAHPSPLSARRGFFGSRPFSQANHFLTQWRRGSVDWRLD